MKLNSAWYLYILPPQGRSTISLKWKWKGCRFPEISYSSFNSFFFFELKLFYWLTTNFDFIICLQFNENEQRLCTIFSLYGQDIVKLAQHSLLLRQASIAMHRTDLLCLYLFPSLSDRKPVGLQQQLSSGSHWPQISTSCLSVGRGQVRRWPMGGLYPGEYGTVSYLNPNRVM